MLPSAPLSLLHGLVAPRRSKAVGGGRWRGQQAHHLWPSFVLATEQSLRHCNPAPRAWRANEFPDARCPPHKKQ